MDPNTTPTGNTGSDQSAPGMPPTEPKPAAPAPEGTAPAPVDDLGKDDGEKKGPNKLLLIAFFVVLIAGVVFYIVRR